MSRGKNTNKGESVKMLPHIFRDMSYFKGTKKLRLPVWQYSTSIFLKKKKKKVGKPDLSQ